ncbi:TDT family transporter [Micromonospora sp. CV4]|uniref:SLAC1 family transporter n=1 Tax=Micromonospora sp. CV4 TaxID=2478711 RepID=UPI000EF4AF5D|nr:TDT family transporter [Micromonospora sp. CV4]RLP91274.1 TDT family transporter [Micromonospora sp. CV4]
MASVRVPPTVFGIPFGLAGLAGSWGVAAGKGNAPTWVGDALLALAAVVWLAATAGYVAYTLSVRRALVADLLDPALAPFASLAVITPMPLAAQGLAPHHLGAARIVVDVFLVLTVLFGAWITGQWIYGPLDLDRVHPGYFLPTVAGGLVASASAAAVGQRLLSLLMLGLGLVCWLVIGSLTLHRLFFRPPLPPALIPTLAIEVAPPALAAVALFALNGARTDLVVSLVTGYGLLMVLTQVRLLPAYLSLSFVPTFWAFTFPFAAVATTTLHWIADTRPSGHRVYAYLVLAAITVLIGGIAVRTVVAAARGQLLPPAPAPTRPAR